MTGWRLGYLAARGEALENMLKIHQYVQACASSISQRAALAAVSGPQDCVRMMREEFRRRRDVLVEGLRSMGVEMEARRRLLRLPEGGGRKRCRQ